MEAKFTLKVSEIRDLMSSLHDIPSEKRDTLMGRIKHFQRDNFPPGTQAGRGKVAAYGWDEIVLIAIALELLEAGVMPEVIKLSFENRTKDFLSMLAAQLGDTTESKTRKFLVLEINALDKIRGEKVKPFKATFINLDHFTESFGGEIEDQAIASRPVALIDLTGLASRIIHNLEQVTDIGRTVLTDSFSAWVAETIFK